MKCTLASSDSELSSLQIIAHLHAEIQKDIQNLI